MLRPLADQLLSLAFPVKCHGCGGGVTRFADGVACENCWSKTRIIDNLGDLCGKCGSSSPGFAASTCRGCYADQYDRAVAVGVYEHALVASVLELKQTPKISGRLSQMLISAFELAGFEKSSIIVPVPLSAKRRHERGFNQAEVIAAALSKASGLAVDSHSLIRKVHTPVHRAGMDRKARELTVKNAFTVNRPHLVEGRNILLVDDIFTSGATASYCAKALKKSGAARVDVLTLARAEYR